MNNYHKFKKGFGILEVMVAAMIIITILAALVFISHAAINNSVYTQQRAQATYLAQEGIETVRQIRDTNWIDSNSATQWDTLIWDGTKANLLKVDTTRSYNIALSGSKYGLEVINLPSVPAETIPIPATNGTTYTRTITIALVGNLLPKDTTPPPNPTDVWPALNALKVTTTVIWDSVVGNGKSISVSEVITNWRPNY